MSEHDKERLDRLEERMSELMMKADRSETLLHELEARIVRQNQLMNRLLNLLGLSLTELDAEANTPPKPHKLLLLMRRSAN